MKEIKRRVIFWDTWKLCEILTSVSINKISLEQNHIYSFTYYLWLFLHCSCIIQRLWQRSYDLQFPKYLLLSYLQRKFALDVEHQTLIKLLPVLVSSFLREVSLLWWDSLVEINTFLTLMQNLAVSIYHQQGYRLQCSGSLFSVARLTYLESWHCSAPATCLSYFTSLELIDLHLRIVVNVKSMLIFIYQFFI